MYGCVRKLTIMGLAFMAFIVFYPFHGCSASGSAKARIPPELSALIQEEMLIISDALEEIVRAVVIGEHQVVSEKGRIIYESSILNEGKAGEESHQLFSSLPKAFIAFDRRLHRSAMKMAVAADERKIDLERYYISEMIETCVNCHKVFAKNLFPSLGN